MNARQWTAIAGTVVVLAALAWIGFGNVSAPRQRPTIVVGQQQVTAPRVDEGIGAARPLVPLAVDFVATNRADFIGRAQKGDQHAIRHLANALMRCNYGYHVPACKEFKQAISGDHVLPWVELAAESGDVFAQLHYLDAAAGLLAASDTPDYVARRMRTAQKGVDFLKRAAAAGETEAMLRLGLLLSNGKFVPYDPKGAYLYGLAGAFKMSGNPDSIAEDLEQTRAGLIRYRRDVPSDQLPILRQQARELSQCCG